MMWPWLERLPLLEFRGITLPEFQTLNVYIGNMWQTGNGIFPHLATGSPTIPLHNLIYQRPLLGLQTIWANSKRNNNKRIKNIKLEWHVLFFIASYLKSTKERQNYVKITEIGNSQDMIKKISDSKIAPLHVIKCLKN